ncbi:hypothetical protein MPTK1_6g03840 [Marchantia polymorpha subsp. ruderalis]|uniref:Uncharacterized protein n=2 Tax=Marchantia polymorpha TaxID=3197 RepID=A0AAF6BN95_MARPO|nr:hypothetical protein MARPO_0034s0134 [Marchantia polymorpha]BBN13479.1 hypothetical protein Mp_6g03840 [Marchantia polymorpha subsp. ruderalis]|eukprot:PTQ41561.1 hypothetical protein MARPO_0034s0134 [Marchantia polymorpha]
MTKKVVSDCPLQLNFRIKVNSRVVEISRVHGLLRRLAGQYALAEVVRKLADSSTTLASHPVQTSHRNMAKMLVDETESFPAELCLLACEIVLLWNLFVT